MCFDLGFFFYTCVSSSHENKIDQYQKSMNLQCVNVQESIDICCIYSFEKLDHSRTPAKGICGTKH